MNDPTTRYMTYAELLALQARAEQEIARWRAILVETTRVIAQADASK